MPPKASRRAHARKHPVSSKNTRKIKTRTPEKLVESRRLRLYQQLDKGFYLNALKTCNQLLNKQAGAHNPTWIETKAKLLAVLERYQETIEFISEQAVKSAGLELLEAYCFYKLGNIEKASDVLSTPRIADDMGRAKLALESQIMFKLGRYVEAKANLEDLLVDSPTGHPEYVDLNANLAACEARIKFIEKYIPSQTSLIKIEQLEAVPITSSFFHSHHNFASSGSRASRPTKPVRSSKPNKPLDPSRPPPDPDRWLPRREKEISKPNKRSNSKHKKAKEKLATQGSVSAPPRPTDSSHKTTKQTHNKKKGTKSK